MTTTIFREAVPADIQQMQVVRNAVRENVLSDPKLVTDAQYLEFLSGKGKGWVCVVDDILIGFAIADLEKNNIWALFVHPAFERQGIGKKLHQLMLDWYFSMTSKTVWLSTAPHSRAAQFYMQQGWACVGNTKQVELKFEITADRWRKRYASLL